MTSLFRYDIEETGGEMLLNYERDVQQAIQWIETHLQEPISTSHVCEVIGFSKYHFHRIFQHAVGMTITAYIRKRRLANASSMLLHTNERMIDVAVYFQFESQEAFTRAFKNVYGLPPGRYRKVMRDMKNNKEDMRMEEKMKGWFLSGSHPYNYEIGIDQKTVHQGKVSGYLKSKTVHGAEEFATMMQQFKANEFKGERVKLSGFLKTEDVKTSSGLWMRVDSASEDVLQFDNMHDRLITGTNDWNQYSIVLDVPENSAVISFGLLLVGSGQVWIDGLRFETVGSDTPTTNMSENHDILERPINLSFEE